MAEQFKIGDVVQLKSGGPHMTVCGIPKSDGILEVACAWFPNQSGDSVSLKDRFPMEAVDKI